MARLPFIGNQRYIKRIKEQTQLQTAHTLEVSEAYNDKQRALGRFVEVEMPA
jgi:hypothetical protein